MSVADHCLRSRNYVNLIVSTSSRSCNGSAWTRPANIVRAGLPFGSSASNDNGGEPDVVLACAGDVPTLETVATAWLLRKHLPEIRVRVVNVVDLGV